MFESGDPHVELQRCPFRLVEILRCIGRAWLLQYRDRRTKGVNEILKWISLRIEEETGVGNRDVAGAIKRLGLGCGLQGSHSTIGDRLMDGYTGRPIDPDVAKECPSPICDFTFVVKPLQELDRNGTTASLWAAMHKKWPFIGRLLCSFTGDLPAAPDDSTGGNKTSSPAHQAVAAKPVSVGAKTQSGPGRKPLAETDPVKWQVYLSINQAVEQHGGPKAALAKLQSDPDYADLRSQICYIGESLDARLINTARKHREQGQPRK
jgi:hypothetical protein